MRHQLLVGTGAAVLLGLTGCSDADVTEGSAGQEAGTGFTEAPENGTDEAGEPLEVPVSPEATLVDPEGSTAGGAQLTEGGTGAVLVVDASGLAAGSHPVTLHAVGDCTASDGTTAGEVFAATGPVLDGEEYRDLPALVVTEKGTSEYSSAVGTAEIGDLMDDDGFSVVVGPSDGGGPGSGLACAAFTAAQDETPTEDQGGTGDEEVDLGT
ncbi:superoxide dismutase family protein [Geodermatophilus marinus]|uniref:superoxide dismutase family protein n=1 Tax=Geodermatophilus sp. LHW52908 TaxID=2303986 RepID=UPI000E3BE824|nr:superoxide dismutase family protein [Geodermatophilus sp. LHW52908]RFU20876.1 hypothetical protein D0Z06_13705 [Geodermatophilus sp. LHW52908]